MSYSSYEESRHHGQPANLLLFRYGAAATAVHGYTDAEQPLTRNNVTYAPTPMSVGAINASGTLDRKTLSVDLPDDSEVAELFRVYPPSYPVTMTLYRGHLPSPIWLVAWSGKVLNAKRNDDHTVTLSCEPILTALTRIGLRRRYQLMCPHVLYGADCKASKTNATLTALPVSVGDSHVTLSPDWVDVSLAVKFAGGVIEWTTESTTEIRTILGVEENGTKMYLSGPTTGLVDQTVRVTLGCNHAFYVNEQGINPDTDCLTLHDNVLNFGGFPWIPKKQPLGSFINLYY